MDAEGKQDRKPAWPVGPIDVDHDVHAVAHRHGNILVAGNRGMLRRALIIGRRLMARGKQLLGREDVVVSHLPPSMTYVSGTGTRPGLTGSPTLSSRAAGIVVTRISPLANCRQVLGMPGPLRHRIAAEQNGKPGKAAILGGSMDFEYSSEQKLLWESTHKLMERVATPDYLRRLDRERLIPMSFTTPGWRPEYSPCRSRRNTAAPAAVCSILPSSRKRSADTAPTWRWRSAAAFSARSMSRVKARRNKNAHWLPKLISGEIRMSISMSEPDAGSDVGAMRTQARRDGNEYVISGQKFWATGAGAVTM